MNNHVKALIRGLPFDQKVRVSIPQFNSEISRREVNEYVTLLPGIPSDFEWPADWSWDPVVKQGKFRGRLPLRVSAYLEHRYSYDLRLGDREGIGLRYNKFLMHPRDTELIVDCTRGFTWRRGSFGDTSSCFWGGSKRYARDVLLDHEAFALRVWSDATHGRARVWVLTDCANGLILFNAYDALGTLDRWRMACILAHLIGPQVTVGTTNLYVDEKLYQNNFDNPIVGNPDKIVRQRVYRMKTKPRVNHVYVPVRPVAIHRVNAGEEI